MSFWSFLKKKPKEPEQDQANDPPSNPKDEAHYRADDLLRLAVHKETRQMLFLQRRLSRVVSLPIEEAELLTHCTPLASLDKHRDAIAQSMGLDEENSLREQLQHLVDAKVLCEELDLIPDEPNPPTQIDTLATITKDRPEALSRCLQSFLQSANTFERKSKVVVCDDSTDPTQKLANQDALRALNKQSQAEIFYVGADEKQAFYRELERQGISARLIDFAFFDAAKTGYTPGANRNSVLLATLGSAVLSVDDDTRCTVTQPKETRHELAISSEQDLLDASFFLTREDALRGAPEVEIDPIAAHERILGSAISKTMRLPWAKHPLEKTSSALASKISKYGGRIAVTANGMAGDSGMGSPAWFAHGLNERSLQNILQSEERYRLAFQSRELNRVSDRYKITDNLYCMGMFLGLDNREMLPPFFPALRNEDGVFALTLRSCSEYFYLGHIPLMMQHLAHSGRAYDTKNLFSTHLLFSDVLFYCFAYASSFIERSARSLSFGLKRTGSALKELGSLPAGEWSELLTTMASRSRSQFYEGIQSKLRSNKSAPDFWRRDLALLSEQLFQHITSPDLTTPIDLLHLTTRENIHAFAQRLVYQFGELLSSWEEIIAATRYLAEKNITLGRAL